VKFTKSQVQKISEALAAEAKHTGKLYRIVVENPVEGRKLSLEIHPDIPIDKKIGNLISVFTIDGLLQLHFCTGFVISKALGEVTFVAEHNGKLSGLIITKEAGCSLFANVDTSVLSGDFNRLGPEVALSGVALLLTEQLLPSTPPAKKPKRTGKS
jgi:hypothetical protein